MAIFSGLQLMTSYFFLPETLPRERRTSMRPAAVLRNYSAVLRSQPFWLLTLALSCNFIGFFLYVSAAPIFVVQYLELSKAEFGWLFIPATTGIIFGAYLAGKLAKRFTPLTAVSYGYLIMAGATVLNVVYNAFLPPVLPWVILPVALYTVGMSFVTPTITLLTLDLFPSARGMAASLQGFVQTMVMTLASGLVAPLVADSGLAMALTVFCFLGARCLAWFCYTRLNR
ncbi:MFS transporter [Castellaniella sp. S9]|uniref:MFS transporter n=1 Tax=Castellaniella sp. S9 TaxID=2993652 RepID=UPI0022B5116B|nr:MFS transporter [Castellaniella sp. S9]